MRMKMASRIDSALSSAHQGSEAFVKYGRDIMAHMRRLSHVYLLLRIVATIMTTVWAASFSYALWNTRFDKDKRERLTAINNLWLGSRSGVLFTLIAHWAFTIAVWYMTPLFGTVVAAAIEYLRFQG